MVRAYRRRRPYRRFVAAPAPELTGYHPEAQVYTEMSPEQFLRNLGVAGRPTSEDGEFYIDRESLERVKARLEAEQEIDPLFLEYDIAKGRVTKHEGRHRARAAIELGIERVPVIVYFYDSFKYYPVRNRAGVVYDQTHYVPVAEMNPLQREGILEDLGAARL